jgi:hypothetical protein
VSRANPTSAAPSSAPTEATHPPWSRWNLLAIAALVAGLVGFVLYPVVPSILAIVLGLRARRQIDSQPGSRGRLAAETGVVLGWAAIALLVLSGAGLIAVFAGIGGG